MCFSAEASFGAGALLSVIGIATIKQVQDRSQFPFALLPFVFAFQQFSEGFVWITLADANFASWQYIPIYIFIVIAQVVWPVLVPLAILLMERDAKRRKILTFLLIIGITLAAYHIFCLFNYNVYAEIKSFHIYYALYYPHPKPFLDATFYLIPTIMSPFFSSIKKMKILGTLIFFSFIVSLLFFTDYVLSVWCFFAAIISGVIYLILKQPVGLLKIEKIQAGL